ncbi:MAG: PorT family protein [Gemmatimonadales bacterium]|nr:MAG: PorT family protein [Gemmatimonadales bacterium]
MRWNTGLSGLGLVLLLLASTSPASAQLGIRGGVNLTDLVGGGVEQSENRTGLSFGAGYDLLTVGPVSVGPEIFYAQRGADAFVLSPTGEAPSFEGPAEVALEYIEIPITARVRLPTMGRLVPYLMGGPVFGWNLECSVTVDAGAGGAQPSCDDLLSREGFESKVREYEQGFFLGGGVGLSFLEGIGNLTLEARFIEGLSRLGEGDEGPEVKNRAFSLMLGYAFGF